MRIRLCLFMFVFLLPVYTCSCSQRLENRDVGPKPTAYEAPSQNELSQDEIERIVDRISKISLGMPEKLGEPHWDADAKAILSLGERATPFLLAKITDDSTTELCNIEVVCRVGDIAHRLLCEVYSKDLLWMFEPRGETAVAPITPTSLYGHRRVTYRNYFELVSTSEGRELLKRIWQEEIRSLE